MRNTGIIRKIDQMGRVVVPSEMRTMLNLNKLDYIEISTDGTSIVLRKTSGVCMMCGGSDDLIDFDGKWICKNCASTISSALNTKHC